LLKVAGSNLGNKHSMLTRKMISESALGRTFSKETRIKISDALKGRILSEDTKIKIRNYKHTLACVRCVVEAKLKISLNHHRTKPVKIEDLLSRPPSPWMCYATGGGQGCVTYRLASKGKE
jgi:hypothetical protein